MNDFKKLKQAISGETKEELLISVKKLNATAVKPLCAMLKIDYKNKNTAHVDLIEFVEANYEGGTDDGSLNSGNIDDAINNAPDEENQTKEVAVATKAAGTAPPPIEHTEEEVIHAVSDDLLNFAKCAEDGIRKDFRYARGEMTKERIAEFLSSNANYTFEVRTSGKGAYANINNIHKPVDKVRCPLNEKEYFDVVE